MSILTKQFKAFEIFNITIKTNILALIVPLLFSLQMLQFGWMSAVSAYIALIIIIIVHELGHATAAKLMGARIYGIQLTWLGGLCKINSSGLTARQIAIFASGGIIAQCLLALTSLPFLWVSTLTYNTFLGTYILFTIKINLLLALFNLIPIKPLDGKIIFDYLKNK